jgi:hypothetical protein
MNPFTVDWTAQAINELAAIWLQAADQNAVSAAEAQIDHQLRQNPLGKGRHLGEGLYLITVSPLHVFYTIDVARRFVEVTDVGYVP